MSLSIVVRENQRLLSLRALHPPLPRHLPNELFSLSGCVLGGGGACADKMFVYNYCPLTFMSSSGGNITPDK